MARRTKKATLEQAFANLKEALGLAVDACDELGSLLEDGGDEKDDEGGEPDEEEGARSARKKTTRKKASTKKTTTRKKTSRRKKADEDVLREKMLAVIEEFGNSEAKKILKKFDATKVSELEEGDFAEVIELCDEALEEVEPEDD